MGHRAWALGFLVVLATAPAAAQTGTPVVTPPAPTAPAAPTGSPTGAVDPNQEVTLDLDSGRFLAPLPFDVPFTVRGKVTAGVRAITARMLRFADTVNCLQQRAQLDAAPSLGPASLVSEGGQPEFLLPVPALQVNRYYCFEFTRRSQLPDPAAAQFRQRAAETMDAALRPLAPGDVANLAAYEELRAALVSAVKALLGPNQVLEAPAGSFFGPGKAAEVSLAYRVEFDTILARQDQRRPAVAEFRQRQADSLSRLVALRGSDAYRRFAGALQTERQTSLSLDEFLKARPGALALASLGPDDLQALVLGVEPGGRLPNLDRLFAAAEVQAMAQRLAAAAAGLDDLRAVVDALNQNQVLRAAAGLDDAAGKTALKDLPDPIAGARLALRRELFTVQSFAAVLADREKLILDLAGRLEAQLEDVLPIAGTTVGGFELRASWYISADIGVATATQINEVFAYVGANVYLRPVNKRAHLRWASFRQGFWDEFRKRFAFTIGLPYNGSSLDKAGERSGVLGDRPLIVGAGFRINDLIRVAGGALVFKVNDPNPLITKQHLGTTPYFGLSVDWDARSSFVNVFKAASGSPTSP
jgi:hypothetical protein